MDTLPIDVVTVEILSRLSLVDVYSYWQASRQDHRYRHHLTDAIWTYLGHRSCPRTSSMLQSGQPYFQISRYVSQLNEYFAQESVFMTRCMFMAMTGDSSIDSLVLFDQFGHRRYGMNTQVYRPRDGTYLLSEDMGRGQRWERHVTPDDLSEYFLAIMATTHRIYVDSMDFSPDPQLYDRLLGDVIASMEPIRDRLQDQRIYPAGLDPNDETARLDVVPSERL